LIWRGKWHSIEELDTTLKISWQVLYKMLYLHLQFGFLFWEVKRHWKVFKKRILGIFLKNCWDAKGQCTSIKPTLWAFLNTTLSLQERITISPPTQQKRGTTYKNNPLKFNSRIQVDFWVSKSWSVKLW